jgi:hypothetical protein
MAFPAFSRWNQKAMPYLALLEADLASMAGAWSVRIWLILTAVQSLTVTVAALSEGNAPDTLASLLGTFPVVWSTFAIIVSSGAISSEAGVVADSILSKAVSRYAYLLAKLSSRLITVLGVYLIVTLPPIFIVARQVQDGLAGAGVVWSILRVGMALVLLTSLAVTFSAILGRTLVVVVVVWLLWYVAGALFALLGFEYLSPLLIVDNLPGMLRGDFVVADQVRILIGFGGLSSALVLAATWHFARKDL